MEQTNDEKLRYVEMCRQQQLMNNGFGTPLYAIIIIAIVLLLSSCATKTRIEYRDRDVNHYITNTVHDTLIDKTTDSVYFEVMVKGDTVYQTKYKEKARWRDRVIERHDTCWRDSVVTEYKETVKEVTKIPKIFKISLIFSILCCIFVFVKLLRWLKIL
jgi:hypothetical protein